MVLEEMQQEHSLSNESKMTTVVHSPISLVGYIAFTVRMPTTGNQLKKRRSDGRHGFGLKKEGNVQSSLNKTQNLP